MLQKSSAYENSRLDLIMKWLRSGKSREETAAVLGYKNWRGLDIFMRRHGMKWDSANNAYYVPEKESGSSLRLVENTPPKIAGIISKFGREDADPMEIAREEGFDNHRLLSSYMAARGYKWSDELNNYVKSYGNSGQFPESKPHAPDSGPGGGMGGNGAGADSAGDDGVGTDGADADSAEDIQKYLPFFRELFKNRDRLLEILNQSPAPGEIPRYAISGITRTKSFYMSDAVSKLICEFSQRRNITQKEIIETAVIEFLRKYSFKSEVDSILGK